MLTYINILNILMHLTSHPTHTTYLTYVNTALRNMNALGRHDNRQIASYVSPNSEADGFIYVEGDNGIIELRCQSVIVERQVILGITGW